MSPKRGFCQRGREGHSMLMDRKQKRHGNQQWRVWCEESGGWEYQKRSGEYWGLVIREYISSSGNESTLVTRATYVPCCLITRSQNPENRICSALLCLYVIVTLFCPAPMLLWALQLTTICIWCMQMWYSLYIMYYIHTVLKFNLCFA